MKLTSRFRVKAWVLLKLLLQRLGIPRQATLCYPSPWGWRYPAFLYSSLKRTEIFECERADLPFFLLHGTGTDFIFRVRAVTARGQFTASAVLAEPTDSVDGFDRVIRIHHSAYVSHVGEHALTAPYFCHPELMRSGFPERASGLRHARRNVRVCFVGAAGPAYDGLSYPILNRNQVLNAVVEGIRDVTVVTERGQVPRLGETGVLLAISGGSIDDARRPPLLTQRQYVELLSRSDFFIAAPGVVMPHCHNVIEAMALGTIPILNYPELFSPPLTPDGNCLAFSTADELLDQIRRAVSLTAREIRSLRSGVVEYYDAHVSPAAFSRKVQASRSNQTTIHVNAELGRGSSSDQTGGYVGHSPQQDIRTEQGGGKQPVTNLESN